MYCQVVNWQRQLWQTILDVYKRQVLAYDGGIYNNFPTDVMTNDFHPDIIIGSVVSANPTKPKENDLMSQIENMVMQKTDYSIPDVYKRQVIL